MISTLPYAVILHCFFAIIMYSVPSLFPQNAKAASQEANDVFMARVFHPNSYIFVILVSLIIFYKFFLRAIFKAIRGVFSTLCCCCCCKKQVVEEYAKDQGTYLQEIIKIKNSGLETYDIGRNENYTDLIKAVVDFTSKRTSRKRRPQRRE